MIREDPVTITVADGVRLEATLALPEDRAGGVVIAHPHPLYGGDMDNPVVVRVAEVCGERRLATLRFNFRGVGRSTGGHDDGRGEQTDVQAALDHLASVLGGAAPIALAGYSFGASMAAAVAARRGDLAGLLLVAPPLAVAGLDRFPRLGAASGPILVVGAGADTYCPPAALERLRAQAPAVSVRVIEGATHFFFGKLYPLGEAVAPWAEQVASGAR
jgi:hypothetical protein